MKKNFSLVNEMPAEVFAQFRFIDEALNAQDQYYDRIHLFVEWFHAQMKASPPTDSNVIHPSHYNQGQIECIDAIHAALTPEEFRGFVKGNALKYVWRERAKNGDEDLEKTVWYISDMLKRHAAANKST